VSVWVVGRKVGYDTRDGEEEGRRRCRGGNGIDLVLVLDLAQRSSSFIRVQGGEQAPLVQETRRPPHMVRLQARLGVSTSHN